MQTFSIIAMMHSLVEVILALIKHIVESLKDIGGPVYIKILGIMWNRVILVALWLVVQMRMLMPQFNLSLYMKHLSWWVLTLLVN